MGQIQIQSGKIQEGEEIGRKGGGINRKKEKLKQDGHGRDLEAHTNQHPIHTH